MKIIDLNGCELEVTNLENALKQVREFKKYSHAGHEWADFDRRQKIYWTDLYQKLLVIKKKQPYEKGK